jgi:hypothetical protein
MCEKCIRIDGQLATFRRFMHYPVDPLTAERLKSGVEDLEGLKKALHPSACAEAPP